MRNVAVLRALCFADQQWLVFKQVLGASLVLRFDQSSGTTVFGSR